MTKEIFSTYNYNLFSFLDGKNRPLAIGSHRGLFASMQKFGYIDDYPIRVVQDGDKLVIKDGQHRYSFAQTLGLPVQYVLSLNLHRRHLTPSQLAMVGARARDIFDKQARERMRAGGGDRKSLQAKSGQANLPEAIKGQSRDKAARVVNVGGRTIDTATKVLKTKNPKLIKAVDADLIAVSTAAEVAHLPHEEQDALVEEYKQAKKEGRKPSIQRESLRIKKRESSPNLKGKSLDLAQDAINILKRIPRNDPQRPRAFQMVTDWIRRNK